VARLDKITNINPEPGDTVRHRGSKQDYVVHNAVTLAGGAGTLFYLLKTLDGSSLQFKAHKLDDEDMYIVRKNVEQLSPQDVIRERAEHLSKAFKGNQELIQRIEKGDSAVYRDMLLILKDSEEGHIQQNLLNLADHLVFSSNSTNSKEDIVSMLHKALGDNADTYSVEHIDQLAESLHKKIQQNVKVSTITTLNQQLNNAASKVNGASPGDLPYSMGRDFGFTKFLRNQLFQREDPQSVGALEPVMRKFSRLTGDGTTKPIPKAYRAQEIFKNLKERKLITSKESSAFAFGSYKESNAAIKGLLDSQGTGSFVSSYLRYLELHGADKKVNKLWNKRTATQSRYRGRISKPVSIGSLLANPAEINADGSQRFFSINSHSLVHEVLAGKTLTVNGQQVSASDKAVRDLFRQQVGSDRGQVLVSAKAVRQLSTQKEVDLGNLLTEHTRVANNLGAGTVSYLESKAGTTSSAFQKNPVLELNISEGGASVIPGGENTLFRVSSGLEDKYFSGAQFAEAQSYSRSTGVPLESAVVPPNLGLNLEDSDLTGHLLQKENVSFQNVVLPTGGGTNLVGEVTALRQGDVYERVREESRMGYALIKSNTGKSAVRLVGTDTSVPINEGLERGLVAIQQGGRGHLILDVGSQFDKLNGTHGAITAMGLGFRDHTGAISNVIEFSGGTPIEEVRALAALTRSLNNAESVGTQTSYHFDALRSRIQTLKGYDFKGATVYVEGKKLSAAEALAEIETSINKAYFQKSYDLITLGQASGKVRAGNASRSLLANMLLREKEAANGIEGVHQAFKIADKLGLQGTSLEGMVGAGDRLFFSADTKGELPGSLLRLHGFENSGIGNSGVRAVFERMEMLEGGAVRGTGSRVSLDAMNTHMLGASISKLRQLTLTDGKLGQDQAGLVAEWTGQAAKEQAGRIIRGISSIVTSSYNRTGVHTNFTQTAWGLHELTVHSEIKNLLQKEARGVAVFDRIAGQTKNYDDIMDNVIDRMVQGANMPVMEESRQAFEASLRLNLEEALRNPTQRKMYEEGSNLSNVIDSEFGQRLISTARQGMDGDTRAMHQAMLMSINMAGRIDNAHELHSAMFTGAPTMGLRVSSKSGAYIDAVSFALNPDTAMTEVEVKVRQLASQTLLSFSRENRADINHIVRGAGISDVSGLRAAVTNYANSMNIHDSIPNLNSAMASMHFLDKNGEYGDIPEALENIMRSDPFKKRLMKSVLDRKEKFLEDAADINPQVNAKEVAEMIEQQLHTSFGKHEHGADAMHDFMGAIYKKDSTGVSAYFTDAYERANLEHLIPMISREATDDIVTTSEKMLGRLDGKGGGGLMDLIMEQARKLNATAYEAKMDDISRKKLIASFVDTSTQLTENSGSEYVLKSLNAVALHYQGLISEGIPKQTTVEAMTTIATKAATIATENSGDDVFKQALKVQHEGLLGEAIVDLTKQRKVMGALIVAGGVAAMLAGITKPKEQYSGGYASDQSPGVIGAMSEIPGDPEPPNVFTGQTQPFKLKINVKGYVKDKNQLAVLESRFSNVASKYSNGRFSKQSHTDRQDPIRLRAYEELKQNV